MGAPERTAAGRTSPSSLPSRSRIGTGVKVLGTRQYDVPPRNHMGGEVRGSLVRMGHVIRLVGWLGRRRRCWWFVFGGEGAFQSSAGWDNWSAVRFTPQRSQCGRRNTKRHQNKKKAHDGLLFPGTHR